MANPTRSPRVLVVEDHDALRLFVSIVLSDDGYPVVQARSEEEAMALLSQSSVGAMFVDLDSPYVDGAAMLAAFRAQRGQGAPIVACPPLERKLAPGLSSAVLVRKPFSTSRLLGALRMSLEARPEAAGGHEPARAA